MTYYWKLRGSDIYHWHKTCEHVPLNVESNLGWGISNIKPYGREQCSHCKSLDC